MTRPTKLYSIALTSLLSFAVGNTCYADVELAPYTATYSSTVKGITAELKQSLEKTGEQQWALSNKVSIFLMGFEESSRFTVNQATVKPQAYEYKNQISRKRSSKLNFDWKASSVTDSLHPAPPVTLVAGVQDKLSFQVQLRLELMASKGAFDTKTYTMVDRNKLKTYQVKNLGEETITTPAGEFRAIKLEQRRPGRDKHTLIWLAKDWQYFLLRIERVDEGKSDYRIEVQKALIDGQRLKPT